MATGNCFFHCGCPGGVVVASPCTGVRVCAHAVGLGGSPISELTASITFTNPAVGGGPDIVASGGFDANGNFCADPPSRPGPPVVYGTPRWATVTTPHGASVSAPIAYDPISATCRASFQYCKKVVIGYAYDGDHADPGSGGALAATIGYGDAFVGGQVPDSYSQAPVPGFAQVGNTGVWTYEQVLSFNGDGSVLASASFGILPSAVAAAMAGYYGDYWCACNYPGGPACVACGGTQSVGVPLFLASKYVWNPDCASVECPTAANLRTRVTPKRLYATFSGPAPILGGDSGKSIAIDWDSASWDGRDDHPHSTLPGDSRAIVWHSACGVGGGFGGCYAISTANCQGIQDYRLLQSVPFGSRRITLGRVPGPYPYTPSPPSIGYTNYWNATCDSNDPAPVCAGSTTDGTAIRPTPSGYCPWTEACPPYATLPPASGPRFFYPKSVGFSLGDPAYPSNPWICQTAVNLSSSAVLGTCATGNPTVSVVVTE